MSEIIKTMICVLNRVQSAEGRLESFTRTKIVKDVL
jgi:hypothetical protein